MPLTQHCCGRLKLYVFGHVGPGANPKAKNIKATRRLLRHALVYKS